jgi:hypothetical protein
MPVSTNRLAAAGMRGRSISSPFIDVPLTRSMHGMYGMASDSTPQWLTYAEAAARLGVSSEAVRARVIRGAWRRQVGNDGLARIVIPEGVHTPDQQPINGRSTPVRKPTMLEVLREHIATLKTDNERLMTELSGEREQLAGARAAADRATAELVELARRLAAIAETRAEPEPPRRGVWGWFLRN